MCNDIFNSCIVPIRSRAPSPADQICLRRLLHLSNLSFFWPLFNSLGTQGTNFFTRLRSPDRIFLIVSYL
jgi:hypothetical protein